MASKSNPKDTSARSGMRTSCDSVDNAEALPLYESFDAVEEAPDAVGNVPAKNAAPGEVRQYLSRLLIVHRKWNPDEARRTASKWTIGGGNELVTYSAIMYLDIFGIESGWILYNDVRMQAFSTSRVRYVRRLQTSFLCSVILELVSIFLAVHGSVAEIQVAAVIFAMFFAFGVIILGVFAFSRPTLDSEIAADLHHATNKSREERRRDDA